ncbi:MAG TPA: alpha/beta fold hydrolase [Actinophytocola sp.]|uniref:alpha/beta fold hydrolase n=1 Tax=Actinophytocola sp. TaxID=1872138 RepID=UPI002DDDB0C6|nr:alpha/beta fold hydrolase [Actinophytocola sp.]HEV2777772.1 alpha/beta fold hydrolase [Actinophytocola sp.]
MSATDHGPATGAVTVDGRRLVFDQYGTGDKVIVLLHGLLMRRSMHEPLAAELASRGYRVVCLDMLGHGDSDRPADRRLYSMELYGRHVVGALDELGVRRAIIGGTSLGANIALEVAVQAPERVHGLLIDMPVLEDSQTFWAMVIGPLLAMYSLGRPVLRALGAAARRVPRGNYLLDILLDWLRPDPGPSRHVLLGLVYGRKAPPARDRRRITAPTLVIAHRGDYSHAISDAYDLVGELPNARLTRAKSIVELRARPDRLTEEISRFLDTCWPRPEPVRLHSV